MYRIDFKHLNFRKVEFGFLEIFTLGYILVFTILALLKNNYEFLYYVSYMLTIVFFVSRYYKRFHLTYSIMFFMSLFGFLHLMGGNFYLNGTRLYDFWLIGDYFKWDNLVHAVGGVIATIISFNILVNHIDREIKHHFIPIILLLVTIASGLGAYNELLELIAVVFFGAAEAVGDYMNNALDLFYNFIGSFIAAIVIYFYQLKLSKMRK